MYKTFSVGNKKIFYFSSFVAETHEKTKPLWAFLEKRTGETRYFSTQSTNENLNEF
jgi:hypothetical protein